MSTNAYNYPSKQNFNEYIEKSFYRTKAANRSYIVSRQDQIVEPSVTYDTLDDNRSMSKSFQNALIIEHDSDKSLPVIQIANKSLLDSFKEGNSPDPHERMRK